MQRNPWKSKLIRAVVGVGVLGGMVGCQSNAGTDALIGGAAGAGLGAAVGSHSHARGGEGALIGGAIGALGGALIGSEQDKREQERASHYYDQRDSDYARTRTISHERTYVDPVPPHDDRDGYRSYRGNDGYGAGSTYSPSRRYYDD